jgi:hypothetical protein
VRYYTKHWVRTAATPAHRQDDAVDLFRLWWGLAEICACTSHFRSSHGDGEDDRVSWKGLVYYLPD